MAFRHHRLPRFWLLVTLGLVLAGVGRAWWWEKQLPGLLEQAAREGKLDACLTYSEQLASLRWLSGQAPRAQGQCRRLKAQQLWQQQHWSEALTLQQQLVNSAASTSADQQRLVDWQHQLETRAQALFAQGDLAAALQVLRAMNADHNAEGTALGDSLRETWDRNRLQLERVRQLIPQRRWWEALDALNRLDHPWWQAHSAPQRRQVQAGIASLKAQEDREHNAHGDGGVESNVPADRLDALVRRHIAEGLEDGQAFIQGCRDLGGRVVESGPESACRR